MAITPALLINKTRGSIIESSHYGDLVVVDVAGKILYSMGNAYLQTFIRSAAKPFQAINVINSGAAKQFSFSASEIAIMCASHYGESFHIKTIEQILQKIGLTEKDLLCGDVTSLNYKYALQLAWEHIAPNPKISDCSGKHAGMLAVCKKANYDTRHYNKLEHPCQQEILRIISEICHYSTDIINIGVDGCGVPVHALPLYNMALGYARFANPIHLQLNYQEAAKQIYDSMVLHPEMISGTEGFCTDLIKTASGKLIGKVGAEGIYCVGIKDKGLGIAVKVRDGAMGVLPPIVIKILKKIKVLDSEELKNLEAYETIPIYNDLNAMVGEIQTAFEL